MNHAELEENENNQGCEEYTAGNNCHGQVALGAKIYFYAFVFPEYFFSGKAYSRFNDMAGADNADNTGHCNTANTDRSYVSGKNLLGRHIPDQRGDVGSHGQGLSVGKIINNRDHHVPTYKRACADNGCVFQPDDITQANYCRTYVQLKYNFSFVGKRLANGNNAGGKHLSP